MIFLNTADATTGSPYPPPYYDETAPAAAPSLESPPSKRFRLAYTSWTNGGRSSGTYMIRLETRAEVLRRARRPKRGQPFPWRWHYHRCRRDKW